MTGAQVQNPRETAGFFSLSTFFWMSNVLKLGSKQPLEERDLFPIEASNQAERLVDDLESEWLAEERASEQNRTRPRLWKAMMRVIPYSDYIKIGIFRFCCTVTINALPVLLWFFLKSISTSSESGYTTTLPFIIVMAVNTIVRSVCYNQAMFKSDIIAIRLRAAVIGLVYKKILTLNRCATENTILGNTINLVSSDAQAIEYAGYGVCLFSFALLDIIVSLALVWYLVAWQALIGASVFLAVFVYGAVTAYKAGEVHKKAAEQSDKRLEIMKEIIAGIRLVKMYAWEWNFRQMVAKIRRKEISLIRIRGFIVSSICALNFTSSATAGFISVTTLLFTGHSLTSFKVFTLLFALTNVKTFFIIFVADSLRYIADARSACDRMQQLIEKKSILTHQADSQLKPSSLEVYLKGRRYKPQFVRVESFRSGKPALISARKTQETSQNVQPQVIVANVTCFWDKTSEHAVLQNVSMSATSGQLVGITGSVGCGKTSLLMSILGELPVSSGQVSCIGKTAYFSQTPWVFSGTMQENIVSGMQFVEEKYKKVVEVCDLVKDIESFPKRDLTEIGQRGVILSGGQRARVSLARAIYSDADIYLLDDPLSAVDAKVGKHLFDRCIKEYLAGRVRILVTHQVQFLKQTDNVVLLQNGSVYFQGTYNQMERDSRRRHFSILSQGKEDPVDKTTADVTNDDDVVTYLSKASFKSVTVEQRRRSSILSQGKQDQVDIKDNRRESVTSVTVQRRRRFSIVPMQEKENRPMDENHHIGSDSDVITDLHREYFKSVSVEGDHERVDLEDEKEDRRSGSVKWWLYWKYLRAALPIFLIIILAIFFMVVQVLWIAPFWWLSRITEMSHEQQKGSVTLLVYGSIVTVSFLLTTACSFCFYLAALRASEKLHDKTTMAIIKAPVLFFDTNPVGRILNRFSKDIGALDDTLPVESLWASYLCLYVCSATILSAVTNVWLCITCVPLTVLFIYLAIYYLKSAREIRRLEAFTCSPVYSLIADTVTGLEVIHSSEMGDNFLQRFYKLQDKNTAALIMEKASTRWLSIRGDLLSNLLVISVSAGAFFATQNPALAGLSLSIAAETIGATEFGIRIASEAESDMTSVERVFSYTEIDPEPGYNTETLPPEAWPTAGSLTLRDLSLAYLEGAPATLNNISVCVADKEKVGVVGRTGAGKSSLVAALFRMPEPEGSIIIDGVNIKDLNLQASRRSMAVITQDPILFSGSLRRNLDPFSLFEDHDLWSALEEVQMKTLVQQLPEKLEYKLRESGSNFSVGERQLICLARALLQKSKIIILDEAPANVDYKTDRLIQEVIRNRFKDSTVLTIAHRLNTIMDYDKVLVMDQGRVVEFDKPRVLLQNTDGHFSRLVQTQNMSVAQYMS